MNDAEHELEQRRTCRIETKQRFVLPHPRALASRQNGNTRWLGEFLVPGSTNVHCFSGMLGLSGQG